MSQPQNAPGGVTLFDDVDVAQDVARDGTPPDEDTLTPQENAEVEKQAAALGAADPREMS